MTFRKMLIINPDSHLLMERFRISFFHWIVLYTKDRSYGFRYEEKIKAIANNIFLSKKENYKLLDIASYYDYRRQ